MLHENNCLNFNHRRVNAPVRACPACGNVVNGFIPIKDCNEEEHAKSRKDGDKYCVNCGKQLIHEV